MSQADKGENRNRWTPGTNRRSLPNSGISDSNPPDESGNWLGKFKVYAEQMARKPGNLSLVNFPE
jgi:hypothetical protein